MNLPPPLIVGLGGTTRPGSTSERALALALASAEQRGCRTRMFAGAALALESYDPSIPARSPLAEQLVAALRAADGILIATPSYHGSVSGLLKNAIDFTEDMREDARPYLFGRAVGLIVCAEGPQAMGSTLVTMRSIVHALRGWPTPLAAVINSGAKPFAADGSVTDPQVRWQVETVAAQVADFAARERLAQAQAADLHDSPFGIHQESPA